MRGCITDGTHGAAPPKLGEDYQVLVLQHTATAFLHALLCGKVALLLRAGMGGWNRAMDGVLWLLIESNHPCVSREVLPAFKITCNQHCRVG